MNTCKALWTVLVLAGVAANLRTLTDALRRRRRLRESGLNGELAVIAVQAVRGEATTLVVQCLLAGLTAAAWYFPEPLRAEARRYYLACGWTFVACSLLLMADSLLDLRDRRRLFRWKAVKRAAVEGGAAEADTPQGTG
jgi:thiosulfate reductase cytochrome b subunit